MVSGAGSQWYRFLYINATLQQQVTWGDIHFYVTAELVKSHLPDALKPFPTLQDLEKRVAELPRVATYLKNRKQTPF